MAEAGTLEIVGRLNIEDIKRGQREINVGFEVMKQKSQSTFGSMDALGGAVKGLGDSLLKVSGVALTGLTGLAGLTPTLAPQFAKLKVETFKLAQVVGRELQPAFDSALEKFQDFNNFISSGTGLANLTKEIGLVAGSTGLGLLALNLMGLSKMAPIVIPIALLVTKIDDIGDIGKTGGENLASIMGAEEGGFMEGALGKAGSIFAQAISAGIAGAVTGAGLCAMTLTPF